MNCCNTIFVPNIYNINNVPSLEGTYCLMINQHIYYMIVSKNNFVRKLLPKEIKYIFNQSDNILYIKKYKWFKSDHFNFLTENSVRTIENDTIVINIDTCIFVPTYNTIPYKICQYKLILDFTANICENYFVYYLFYNSLNINCNNLYLIKKFCILCLKDCCQNSNNIITYCATINNIEVDISNFYTGFIIGGNVIINNNTTINITWNSNNNAISSSGIFTAQYDGNYLFLININLIFKTLVSIKNSIPLLTLRKGTKVIYDQGDILSQQNINYSNISNGSFESYGNLINGQITMNKIIHLNKNDNVWLEYHSSHNIIVITFEKNTSMSVIYYPK